MIMLGSGLYISEFLLIGCVILLALLIFCICDRFNFRGLKYNDNILNSRGKEWFRWIYFLLIVILGWCGLNMVQSYMYPNDEKLMQNADCHVISHKGFEVRNQQFYFACGNTLDTVRCPQIALWDDRSGVALLRGDSIVLEEYLEPFYYKRKTDDSYRLANAIIDDDVSNGFTIQIGGKDYCTLSIKNEDERCDYVLTVLGRDTICDTSSFHRNLSVGYPLIDIIAMMPSVEIDDTLEKIFSDSYLVKEVLNDKDSKLIFMPGESFFTVSDVTIKENSYSSKKTFTLHSVDNISLYSGVGKKATDEISIKLDSCDSGPRIRLIYAVPHMKPLRNINGRVFVTSALEDVDLEMDEGGYLFNIFENEDNFNHIKANFRYSSGAASDSLNFEVIDLYSDDNCRYNVCANQEFLLNTKNKNDNVTWIFEMTDLREANDLKFGYVFWFVILFITFIGLRLLLDEECARSRNLSFFEMSVYVVLLCLGCVRFIFCWRVSTFIPLENISTNVYDTMRNGKFIYTYFILLVPVILILRKDWKNEPYRKFKPLAVFVCYFVILILCYFLKSFCPRLLRIFIIVVPVVFYFGFDLLLTKMSSEKGMTGAFKLVNWVLVSIFLYKYDKGFLAIFLLYTCLYYCVVDVLYSCRNRNNKLKWLPYVLSIVSVVIIFFALKYEGFLLKSAFERPSLLLSIVLIALVVADWLKKRFSIQFGDIKGFHINDKLKKLVLAVLCVAILFGFVDDFYLHLWSLDDESHSKYRAEVQNLDKNHKIDDLILKEEFDSESIEFIMRSAHNQWFLNQYIAAGDSIEGRTKFRLQPHSNQGVTYPTQTTDVVVTRYVLAEHGEYVVDLLLAMFTLLICVYMIEVQMTDDSIDGKINRCAIGGLLLIYAISLSVYLSATNRIVFIGQDFPFISVQSVVAVLYPMLILLIPMLRAQLVRMKQQSVDNESEGGLKRIILSLLFGLLTIFSILVIDRKGKDQNASQFNVSNLVSYVSDKIKIIDDKFVDFQSDNKSLKNKPIEEVWKAFSEEVLPSIRPDSASQSDRFYISLLDYFENKQANKTDINEFLHLRRRNGVCHLAVNKKHYFIPPIMKEDLQWKGSLCAMEVKDTYIISDATEKDVVLNYDNDFKLNLLPITIQRSVPNVNLFEFGRGWIPEDKPLLLLSSEQGASVPQYYCVISDTMEYVSSGKTDQIAFSLSSGDYFMIYKKEKEPSIAYSRKN